MRKRYPLIALLATVLACAICTFTVAAPFIGPPALSRIGLLLPGSECPDLASRLLSGSDLPGEWETLPHPRPETYLQPPLAPIAYPEEVSDGRLFVGKGTNDGWWAVERIYCLRNGARAAAFYYQPSFAGYVDALTVPAGMNERELELSWAPTLQESSQSLSRCRRDPRMRSQFSPVERSATTDTDSCGILARYGRYVVAFEIHWPRDADTRPAIERIVQVLEKQLAGSR